MVESLSNSGISFVAYLLVFGGAAVACFVSATRLTRIDDPDTRRGLVALLATSSGWATAHVAFLLVPSTSLKHAFYLIGLVVGLSAVGAWLYFCSAYTNRSLHRQPVYRRVAVGVFLVIVAVKLTNPLHNLYFTAEFVTSPFPHLAITHHLAHWLVMRLSYALSLLGYFMLLEHFAQVQYKTTPILGLVGITGLPIVFDIIGFTTPYLIDITYEPVGVAIFAVGVAFVYLDTFQAIQFAGGHDEPVILVSADDRSATITTVQPNSSRSWRTNQLSVSPSGRCSPPLPRRSTATGQSSNATTMVRRDTIRLRKARSLPDRQIWVGCYHSLILPTENGTDGS